MTQKGLLALCRLKLTLLGISKVMGNRDSNGYGDEGALRVVRRLSNLGNLLMNKNKLGWEGVAAIANNLTKLVELHIYDNEDVRQGVTPLGGLSFLKELCASTYDSMQGTPERRTGLQLRSPSSYGASHFCR